jgi:protein-disulfide isomerase-like protein with CxxC motif
MAYIGLGVSADLIKSATTAEATDEIRAELRSEIVKALGLDDTTTKAALSEAKEEIELLKAELSAVKEMAAPGGPALRQTQNQALKSSQVDQLRTEAQKWNQMARTVTDPSLKAAYGDKALKIERDADALAKSL